jgi:CubicO group peptidase (beta-lactamase class C family)
VDNDNTPIRTELNVALSRRTFMAVGAGAAAATLLRARPASALPVLRTYHDVTAATQRAHETDLEAQGYRPLSLTIYGSAAAPSFAGVWIQRTGPDFVVGSNLDAAGADQFVRFCAALKYRITTLAATGTAANPRFVLVAEQTEIDPVPQTFLALRSGAPEDSATLQYWLERARVDNLIPRAVAAYGSLLDRRYALALEPNDGRVLWDMEGIADTAAALQTRIGAQGTQNFARPALLALAGDQLYCALFRGDRLTQPVVAKTNLTASAYQTELDAQATQDRYPTFVSAGGSGASRRFAAIFVRDEATPARVLSRRGLDRSQNIDDLMTYLTVWANVPQASLAVIDDRRLIFARSYTNAEAGYPVMEPTALYRMASCCKTLTAMLIMRLIQEGTHNLTLETTAQSVLNLRTPSGGQPTDARFGSITIRQLLTHRSGLHSWYDPAWAAFLAGVPMPPTKAQMASYVASQLLAYAPGGPVPPNWNPYSNFGFVLLGMVVERKLGVSFIDALRSRVLDPLGVTRVRVSPTLFESRLADEPLYHPSRLGVGASLATADRRMVSTAYGAHFHYVTWDGLSLATPDFAKILASFNARSNNPVLSPTSIDLMIENAFGFDGSNLGWPRSAWKGGDMEGSASTIHFREGGISYVLAYNRNSLPMPWDTGYPDFTALRTAVANTTWPAGDLFPSFGIPSF